MKKIAMMICIITMAIMISNTAEAQVRVHVNISSQPLWGPVGYDYVEYYYLPEIGAYYYVPGDEFIYWNGFEWVFVRTLPPAYAYVDLYRTYKVVINEPKPYLRNDYYVVHYASYKKVYNKQVVIKESKDPKYFVVKGHPDYNKNSTVKVKGENAAKTGQRVKKVSDGQDKGNIQKKAPQQDVRKDQQQSDHNSNVERGNDNAPSRMEKAKEKRDERRKKRSGGGQ